MPRHIYSAQKLKPVIGRLPRVLAVLAGLILLVGIGTSVYDWQANNYAKKKAGESVRQANNGVRNGTPATTPVSDEEFKNYHVPPDQPRYIFIPKLGVKAMVLSLGTTNSNQIQSPPNIYKAGWYNKSGLPGKAGAMLIDGHISSWTTQGVFYGLKNLVPGDTIQVQRGDNLRLSYRVVTRRVYNYTEVDMKAALIPIDSTKSGLNLMTCGGSVIAGTNKFNERLVVFAKQY